MERIPQNRILSFQKSEGNVNFSQFGNSYGLEPFIVLYDFKSMGTTTLHDPGSGLNRGFARIIGFRGLLSELSVVSGE